MGEDKVAGEMGHGMGSSQQPTFYSTGKRRNARGGATIACLLFLVPCIKLLIFEIQHLKTWNGLSAELEERWWW